MNSSLVKHTSVEVERVNAVDLTVIPENLRARDQWVCWRYETRNGASKPTKVPVNPRSGRRTDITDPASYCTFEDALKAYESNGEIDGIGFVFISDDPFVGVDIDECVNTETGEIDPKAQDIIDRLDSYTEYSPSGTGVHVIARGALPPDGRKKGDIEMYDAKRYFTFTGEHLSDTPPNIEARHDELNALHSEVFGAALPTREPSVASNGKDLDIELRPDANPPSRKFKTLLKDPNFAQTWERKRDDMADQSPSGYDLSLAIHSAREGWNAQEIADLLIAHRRKHADDLRLNNKQKYQRTIAKALDAVPSKTSKVGVSKKSKAPPQSEIAQAISKSLERSIAWDSETIQWREYHRGIWRGINGVRFQARIQQHLDDAYRITYTSSYLNGVTNLLRGYLFQSEWDTDRNLLPFRNGVLDIRTRKLLPHTPENYLTWYLPFDYDPKATCEPILRWFKDTMEGYADRVELLLAVVNAVLKGRVDLHRFFELIGPAATGKSTFFTLVGAVIGTENCYTTELKQLESNRFEMAAIVGKRLVVITDAEKYGGDTTRLKAMTGGDPLRVERKHQQQGEGNQPSMKMRGMVIIAANEAIQSADYTSGLDRRRLTIPFTQVVPTDKRRDIIPELEAYLPGLVNEALKLEDSRVTELLQNTEKAVPSLKHVRIEQLEVTNPIGGWFLDKIEVTDNANDKIYVGVCKKASSNTVLNTEKWLYPNYVEYCLETGCKPVAVKRFTPLLKDIVWNILGLDGVAWDRDKHGSHFMGIVFRTGNEKYDQTPHSQSENVTPIKRSKKARRKV